MPRRGFYHQRRWRTRGLLGGMCLGFVPGYEASKLDEIEKAVAPIMRNLVDKVEEIVLP